MSERHACRLLGWADQRIAIGRAKRRGMGQCETRLKELTSQRTRFGYRCLPAMLGREGMPANHKPVYRLYREEGLAMRI